MCIGIYIERGEYIYVYIWIEREVGVYMYMYMYIQHITTRYTHDIHDILYTP